MSIWIPCQLFNLSPWSETSSEKWLELVQIKRHSFLTLSASGSALIRVTGKCQGVTYAVNYGNCGGELYLNQKIWYFRSVCHNLSGVWINQYLVSPFPAWLPLIIAEDSLHLAWRVSRCHQSTDTFYWYEKWPEMMWPGCESLTWGTWDMVTRREHYTLTLSSLSHYT